MSTKKEIWRLLEPGVDIISEGDEWLYPGPVWGQVCSPFIGDKVGVHAAQHVCVVRRRMTLPEPQGWISVKERMPTKEDANNQGAVLWISSEHRVAYGNWDNPADGDCFWSTVPNLPSPPKHPDEEAWEEWSKKNLMRNYSVGNAEADAALKEGFMAGRKSVATDGGSHG